MFDFEKTNKTFNLGKRYLDSGRYKSALTIFDALIKENTEHLGSTEPDLLVEVSLNNRGVAKCKLGIIGRDIDLYKDGLNDFEQSINICSNLVDDEYKYLTAYNNLMFGQEEINKMNWEVAEVSNFQNFFRTI